MVRKGGAPKMNQLTLRRFTHKWVFEYHPTLRINMDGSMFLRLGRKTTKYGGEGWIMLRNTYDIGRVERGNILEVVTPLNPTDIICVSQHDPPFSPIFRGFATEPEKHAAIHIYSQGWMVFKDPFVGESSKG